MEQEAEMGNTMGNTMGDTSPTTQVIRNLQKLILELPNCKQRDILEKARQELSDIVQNTVEAD